MNDFYRVKNELGKACVWRQFLQFSVTIFFSLIVMLIADAMPSAIVAKATHALPPIKAYLRRYPIEKGRILKIQAQRIQILNKLAHLRVSKKILNKQAIHADYPNIYPVQSSLLSAGYVKTRAIQMYLPQPIGIVGDDSRSIRWLRKYQFRLQRLHAKIFLVNIDSLNRMQALHLQFPNLPLMPMPGDALATCLKLSHYPVLISNRYIEQLL